MLSAHVIVAKNSNIAAEEPHEVVVGCVQPMRSAVDTYHRYKLKKLGVARDPLGPSAPPPVSSPVWRIVSSRVEDEGDMNGAIAHGFTFLFTGAKPPAPPADRTRRRGGGRGRESG